MAGLGDIALDIGKMITASLVVDSVKGARKTESANMNPLWQHQAASAGLGTLSPALQAMGYTEDAAGNIFYPDGGIMYGPAVFDATRNRQQGIIALPPPGTTTPGSPPGLTDQQWALLQAEMARSLAANNAGAGAGIGIGFDSQGIRFGNSHIGWVWIIALVGLVVLLQSPGFQRKAKV